MLTFTERLPLAPGGRFVVWLFELPTHRIGENRRRGAGAYQRGSDLVTLALWKRSLRRSAAVVAGSEATAAELRSALPELGRVPVVQPGLGPEFSPGVGRRGDRYVLHLGSDDSRDNTETVVAAFERACSRLGASVRLLVAGGARAPAVDGVEHLGRVSDHELVDLYRGAGAFVDASLYEGFGYGPLEAMACGTPVIASDVPAVREVVGDAALLCDPRSADAITGALVRVLEDPGLADDLRRRGLERARGFTWERAADELLGALEEAG